MCVHDQTSPPDDHSAWKKKTQLAFDPERERRRNCNSVKIDSPVFCDWWTASHLIYMNCGQFNIKKKNSQQYMNNAFI